MNDHNYLTGTNYIAALVDELYQLGVREVVISPGSRSTPVAILCCEHQFDVYIDIDERSAAFFALGIAKEKCRPVALLCTSGSAAAHYLPALVEARYSRVPMIVLTADRPPELRQVGAPQTIDQNKLFGGYVNFYEEISLPEETETMHRYVRMVMQKAYGAVMKTGFGTAHINIPLREPLIPDLNKLDFSAGRSSYRFQLISELSQANRNIVLPDSSIFDFLINKNGIIIGGGDAYADYHREVIALAQRLKAPLLADPLSNFRNYDSDVIIDSYQAFLKSNEIKDELKPDYIIQFGQTPVSKSLQQYAARHRQSLFIQVDTVFEYRNPALSTDTYIEASPKQFANALKSEKSNTEYLKKWQTHQKRMRDKLKSAEKETRFFEGAIIQKMQKQLPEGCRLYAANSMAIRDVDDFFEARAQKIKVMGNRGTNGIDGTISTALGIAAAKEPTVLLAGDLALFHDMNGLLTGKKYALNLTIILFNNNGGGIFRYLPQSKEKHFETLFLTPHDLDFSALKSLYGITYYEASTIDDFERCFKKAQAEPGIKLIETKIDLELSKELHDTYTRL
ncbi:2-succinyl-5-enolpyruvyl-6-hydroxy-3-cyclohexene-1-carboxylic-acid synthase [Dehalobacter sp. DCM]|uniref:2-succinyl-5-enolpyruvyl-6-hydroxy-3- cyclohexene-1-carboxylic-acid synthase n=1 Tax=Dehalobacter sp. DCM TaxID=2907827 RepID=UPI0030812395|nr:2-succinyl-5-enolpyruvyl-6-hydroxy-3-cyclohexene-1-carboxylic-acid synthase [Dehalobacter sp. DCM]